jgi:pyruvate dehydrogenase E2 component (dihydrolipoamide acetyltransferase)
MAQEICIPRLGWSMEEGTFVGWLKKDGDAVKEGEPLFELEGEKAIEEVAAIDSGILRIPSSTPEPGSVVAVGAVIGYLTEVGENLPSPGNVPVTPATPTVKPLSRKDAIMPAAPSVRRLARELGILPSQIHTTDPWGRITAADVQRAAVGPAPEVPIPSDGSAPRKFSTPRARALARQMGIDWQMLEGSGRDGRVRARDVEQAGRNDVTVAVGMGGAASSLSSRRKVIAERMRISHQRTVPVTLTSQADATALVALRQRWKASAATPLPSYTEMITKLVAEVLSKHRGIAARWNREQTSLELPEDNGFHVGIAVDTPDGLLVPVLHDCVHRSLADLARESRTLVEKARSGRLAAAQMQGGVFTISTLGSFGIDGFTPVINFPETAILGVGALRREPVVLQNDEIAIRDRLTLSLTFDHAAMDGAPAAAFLQDVVKRIENCSDLIS